MTSTFLLLYFTSCQTLREASTQRPRERLKEERERRTCISLDPSAPSLDFLQHTHAPSFSSLNSFFLCVRSVCNRQYCRFDGKKGRRTRTYELKQCGFRYANLVPVAPTRIPWRKTLPSCVNPTEISIFSSPSCFNGSAERKTYDLLPPAQHRPPPLPIFSVLMHRNEPRLSLLPLSSRCANDVESRTPLAGLLFPLLAAAAVFGDGEGGEPLDVPLEEDERRGGMLLVLRRHFSSSGGRGRAGRKRKGTRGERVREGAEAGWVRCGRQGREK